MYESVGLDGVSLLHERQNWRFVYHSMTLSQCLAVCMPDFRADFVSLFPPLHSLTNSNAGPSSSMVSTSDVLDPLEDEEPTFTIVLSNWKSDAFPLLSVSSSSSLSTDIPRGALAALIRVQWFGRTIETVWKPDVKRGSPCEHKDLWARSTRCSPTAINLLKQVLPDTSDDSTGYSDINNVHRQFFASASSK